ncbi:MAG TPA: rhomboid family intramembrane serine protease [Prolixibacteraceae bacterium]|nr:rhomboid family intramembrane serine protease [Prolixibacteraceae bacterium]
MNKFTFRYFPSRLTAEEEALDNKIFRYSLVIPILFLVIFWMVKLAEIMLDVRFIQWGVYPRQLDGLRGIVLSPLVHADFSHLAGNSASFFVLALALFYFYRKVAMRVFVFNYFLSGALLWIDGRESWHVGASGIIYGLAAFLFFSGLFRRDIRLLSISLIVTFLYGGFLWGLFPTDSAISWEGHLSGAASGTLLSFLYRKYGPPLPDYESEDSETDNDENEDTPHPIPEQ